MTLSRDNMRFYLYHHLPQFYSLYRQMTIQYPLFINALLLIKYWQGSMLWLGQVHYDEEVLIALLLYIFILF